MIEQLQSKKFRALLLAFAAVVTSAQVGDPWYETVAMAAVASVYILAQGWADRGKELGKVLLEAAEKGHNISKQVQAVEDSL